MATNKIDDYSEFTTTENHHILASNDNDYHENICFSQKTNSFYNNTFANHSSQKKRIMTAINRNRNTLKPYKNNIYEVNHLETYKSPKHIKMRNNSLEESSSIL